MPPASSPARSRPGVLQGSTEGLWRSVGPFRQASLLGKGSREPRLWRTGNDLDAADATIAPIGEVAPPQFFRPGGRPYDVTPKPFYYGSHPAIQGPRPRPLAARVAERNVRRRRAATAAKGLIAAALLVPTVSGSAAASTGAQLVAVCAPAAGTPTAACYAYLQAILDDANLVGGNLDERFVSGFGRFCIPRTARLDDVVSLVVKTIRTYPFLRDHNAAIAVRLALPNSYRCPPQPAQGSK